MKQSNNQPCNQSISQTVGQQGWVKIQKGGNVLVLPPKHCTALNLGLEVETWVVRHGPAMVYSDADHGPDRDRVTVRGNLGCARGKVLLLLALPSER